LAGVVVGGVVFARAHELLVGFLTRKTLLDWLVGHTTDLPVAGRAKVRENEKERSAANAIRNAAAKAAYKKNWVRQGPYAISEYLSGGGQLCV
jgi:hypothetical protein